MGEKFQGRYRINTTRLRYWDYGLNAAYFVTICTRNHEHYFGEIKNGIMHLTEIGQIARDYWKAIPQHYPFVKLGKYIIMPNHVHGIIIDKQDEINIVETHENASHTHPKNRNDITVETHNHASLRQRRQPPGLPTGKLANQFGPQSRNLAAIIRGFKSAVKKYATLHGIPFAWQSRYYDHIIRNEQSFYRISEYIKNNPLNWKEDKYFG